MNKVTKGCKFIYKICVEKIFKTPISQNKWRNIVSKPIVTWDKIYMIPFKCSLSRKLRYLQYKILHNILGVNKYLKTVGILNSDLCYLCSKHSETIAPFILGMPLHSSIFR